MKARWFAAAALGAVLVAPAADPADAGSCDRASAGNNPAFAEPRSCAQTSARPAPAKPAGKTTTRAVEVRRESGRTIYGFGDTTIAVGGSVAVDTVVGRGGIRP